MTDQPAPLTADGIAADRQHEQISTDCQVAEDEITRLTEALATERAARERAERLFAKSESDKAKAREIVRLLRGDFEQLERERDTLAREVGALREALVFYADSDSWDDGVDHDDPEDHGEFQRMPDACEDQGERARAALAGGRPDEGGEGVS